VGGHAPRAPEDNMRPRRLVGASRRPLNFTVRLGSPWASAFLGYQALLLTPDGTRNIERAIQLCKQPALSGDAYAAYILGWATFLSGDHAEALKL
jgi:hypothetical protein